MKKLYIGSNLKMYKTSKQTAEYLQELTRRTMDIDRNEMELFIIPSYTALEGAANCTDQAFIRLGAQNMCWEDEGAFTGEISPLMLKELGIALIMIGHSERRHLLGETDQEENKKVKTALRHGFTVLLCIGETAEQKAFGISSEVLGKQLKIGFHQVDKAAAAQIWVAYEPVWSIGVLGTPASPAYVEKMHQHIKAVLQEIFGEASRKIPVLYGGSVNRENGEELMGQPSVDGLFTGRAAWNAENFEGLIRAVKAVSERVRG